TSMRSACCCTSCWPASGHTNSARGRLAKSSAPFSTKSRRRPAAARRRTSAARSAATSIASWRKRFRSRPTAATRRPKPSAPTCAKGREPSLRELLDAGAGRIDTELAGQPDVQSDVSRVIANVYQGLGDYDRAKALTRADVERRRRSDGPRSLPVAAALTQFADAAYEQGRMDE